MWEDDCQWTNAIFPSPGLRMSHETELLGLYYAFQVALCEARDPAGKKPDAAAMTTSDNNQSLDTSSTRPTAPKIVVICDSASAIDQYPRALSGRRSGIAELSSRLGLDLLEPLRRLHHQGSTVEVHWVPGHVDVDGNTRADTLASTAALFAGSVQAAGQTTQSFALSDLLSTRQLEKPSFASMS
ncbi:hypothetical protein GGR56DRAFT_645380 [Xylariaceae sp. FL0804]|nr:hypothetical protein GGR56DRAFT_645380 [Xylariaceae sp. FL0804]